MMIMMNSRRSGQNTIRLIRRWISINNNGGAGNSGSNINPNATTPNPNQTNIFLQPPPSLRHNTRISLLPPPDGGVTHKAPAWMLKYFPDFFRPEDPRNVGPEEHNHPLGVMGVWGYLVTLVAAIGLSVAHIHERFFTNNLEAARAALREQMVREEMDILIKERREQLKNEQEQQHTQTQ